MKDRATRFARRIQIRFWPEDEPDKSYAGYSRNISVTGMFVSTAHPVKPGKILQVEFQGVDAPFRVRGQVMHSAKVSPMLQSVRPSGMGVRFLDRSAELEVLLPSEESDPGGRRRERVFPVYFKNNEEVREVFERDIKNGGLFVPTARPAQLHEEVTIALHLPPPEDRVVTVDAEVVHRVGSGPRTGMGIAFEDQGEVLEALRPLLPPPRE
ncbi:MAG: PilZ domain-containing protein [Thermoanaerobaculia bacterium]|nr:PilZ domain-containing protein [Thermoanaerobaculia bacterium]